jgi:molybdopterin-guanine dinucleotide biosynthesis protein A
MDMVKVKGLQIKVNNMENNNITNIILAGGKSSRMGTNKANLKIGSKSIFEIIVSELSQYTDETVIVSNEPNSYLSDNWLVVSDFYKEKGPLGGIHAGLMKSTNELNFIVSCDLPFANGKLIEKMKPHAIKNDIVVPVINGKLHPLFGFYKKSVLTDLIRCLDNDELRVRRLYDKLKVYFIDERELYSDEELASNKSDIDFFNMNTIEDFQNAISIYEKG